jgi:hypothetical protein
MRFVTHRSKTLKSGWQNAYRISAVILTMTDDASSPGAEVDSSRSKSVLGCTILLILVVGASLASWWVINQRAHQAQGQRADEEFAPVLDKLLGAPTDQQQEKDSAAAQEPEQSSDGYDIDRTMQVIHALDSALAGEGGADSLRSYLQGLAQMNYQGVAPEVLKARAEFLAVLKDIYAVQIQDEQQEAMWEVTSELILTTLSTVQVGGELEATGLGSTASFQVDRARAREALGELRERQTDKRERIARRAELDGQLVEALLSYSEVYYRYVEEWDRLCVLRDRSYLAAASNRWQEAKGLAAKAIELAPNETEAHLLHALAQIELGEGLGEGVDGPSIWLQDFIEKHPDQSAPALLLLGVHKARRGERDGARLDFEQSATYFPRQAALLSANRGPYRQRTFLRKTREGNRILELYKATMLGAGSFSPDLQMAKLSFEEGDFEGGQQKVMDHFSRRRAQQRWDLVLSDLQFCHALLGEDYRRIFPEEAWLDLLVKPTLLGSGLKLAVRNRSPHTLHNATLVLVLQFTDMHPDDYETMTAAKTEPAVLAHETTSFGDLDVELELHGLTKGRDDIVQHRAILVSDEAVIWVDTDEFKIAETEEFRSRRFRGDAIASPGDQKPVSPSMSSLVGRVLTSLPTETSIDLEDGMLRDVLGFTLPRELAALRPLFRLRVGDEAIAPTENLIEGDRIKLRFTGKTELDRQAPPPPVVLEISTMFGAVEMAYAPQPDGSYALIAAPRR